MDFTHVSYTSVLHFLTVAKYMNMRQAAEVLYISQPALSLSISKLEKSLGVTLFYRNKNKLILSKDAETLFPFFEDFRRSRDALVSECISLKTQKSKPLTISFSGSPYTFSALYYAGFWEKYNNGNISFVYMLSSMAQSMLLTGQLDFSISVMPLSHPLISSIKLLSEPIGVVLPVDHPAAQLRSITVKELGTLPIYGLEAKNSFRILCDRIAGTCGIVLNYITEDNYQEYSKRMEDNDRKAAFLSTVQNYEQNFKPLNCYVFREITDENFVRNTSIYFLDSAKKQYQYEDLITLIQTNLLKQLKLRDHYSKLINSTFME